MSDSVETHRERLAGFRWYGFDLGRSTRESLVAVCELCAEKFQWAWQSAEARNVTSVLAVHYRVKHTARAATKGG